jgi:hypothetical protein
LSATDAGLPGVDALENELMQEVVILRRQLQGFDRLAIESDFKRAANIGCAEL